MTFDWVTGFPVFLIQMRLIVFASLPAARYATLPILLPACFSSIENYAVARTIARLGAG